MHTHKLRAVIFDIDGTLSNPEHRLHYVNGEQEKDWNKFFAEMVNDTVNEDVVNLAMAIEDYATVIIVSGRPDSYKEQTTKWLHDHHIYFRELHMRKADDYRQDYIIKQEILADLKERYDIWFVVDDRQQVVDMWRREGLTCLQCATWEEKPVTLLPHQMGLEKLILMVGPPGSGKSTYSRLHLEKSFIISSDLIRTEINNGEYIYDATQNYRVFAALKEQVAARLKYGLTTVVDATNLRRKTRVSFLELLPKGLMAKYVVFNTPLEECIKRNAQRPISIPEEAIRSHYETFVGGRKHINEGDGFNFVKVEHVNNN